MKSCKSRTALLLRAIVAAGAIGLALPASMAMAQDSQDSQGGKNPSGAAAAASKPGNPSGVVVHTPRRRIDRIPPDKRAAFDKAAAKDKAWQRYRQSSPSVTDGTLEQADSYPGLHTLIPH